MKDQLFLMKPGFTNAGMGPFYCGDSVAVEGLLGFFPELREKIDVIYVEFKRPRKPLVELLGIDHQSIPTLVLGDGEYGGAKKVAQGRGFIDDEKRIRSYLTGKFGLPEAG